MAIKIRKQCPYCRGDVVRIQRKASDRLLSLFMGVKRYQCQNDFCAWEGIIQTPST